ncbi:MAG: amidohydrolase family protein [Gemmatimonas sp.]|nr:amidohydrolase family protein [Gemmatimonas sp.]
MPDFSCEHGRPKSLSSEKIRPFATTTSTCRASRMSSNGFPGTRTTSASLPTSMLPRWSLTPSADAAFQVAARNGFQVEIPNGDRAIEYVLDAYEQAQTTWPRPDPRHRIEHATLVNDTLLRRIKELGVVPEPFTTYVHYHGEKWAEYGDEKRSTATKSGVRRRKDEEHVRLPLLP